MGWDAFAKYKGKSKLFKAASARVRKRVGSVDGLLETGGLDCSACCTALENATGASCWDEDGWSAAKVQRLAKSADWPKLKDIPEDNRWAVESARAFLGVCARLKCGIYFSW